MVKTVTLVKVHGNVVSVCVGRNSFAIENGTVVDAPDQRIGAEMRGPNSLRLYEENKELAEFAWEAQEFDEVQEDGNISPDTASVS